MALCLCTDKLSNWTKKSLRDLRISCAPPPPPPAPGSKGNLSLAEVEMRHYLCIKFGGKIKVTACVCNPLTKVIM